MSPPWLSVLLPTYQGETYLARALDGVLVQGEERLEGVEVIAVDDGSTDRTLEILRSWADRLPLTVIAGERRGNWVAGTNRGLAAARGRWISLLHQDDLWRPGRLAALEPLVRSAEADPAGVAMIVHPVEFIDAGGRRLGRWSCPLPARTPSDELVRRLLVQNFLAVPAPLVPAERLRAIGGLDESLWYTADWNLWLELAAAGDALLVDRPLAAFRIHPQSQTATGSARGTDFRRQLDTVLERHLGRHRGRVPRTVERAARFSVEVNSALAARAHGEPVSLPRLALGLAALGPAAGRRYLRDSRIVERVRARLRAVTSARRRG